MDTVDTKQFLEGRYQADASRHSSSDRLREHREERDIEEGRCSIVWLREVFKEWNTKEKE
jgi:hypothetical protein